MGQINSVHRLRATGCSIFRRPALVRHSFLIRITYFGRVGKESLETIEALNSDHSLGNLVIIGSFQPTVTEVVEFTNRIMEEQVRGPYTQSPNFRH